MKTIAERLKEGMELRGVKQADLVRITGISKGSLSSYISGRYAPKRDNIVKLAAALNVSDEWLMGADVPMQRRPSFTDPRQSRKILPKDLFPMEALDTDSEPTLNIEVKTNQYDNLMRYLDLLHKDERYRSLLDGSAKLNDEALDNLVKFIEGLNSDN